MNEASSLNSDQCFVREASRGGLVRGSSSEDRPSAAQLAGEKKIRELLLCLCSCAFCFPSPFGLRSTSLLGEPSSFRCFQTCEFSVNEAPGLIDGKLAQYFLFCSSCSAERYGAREAAKYGLRGQRIGEATNPGPRLEVHRADGTPVTLSCSRSRRAASSSSPVIQQPSLSHLSMEHRTPAIS